MKRYHKYILPAVALIVGAAVGLGFGQLQVSSAKKSAQDKIKEANKKVAFLQQKLMETQSTPPMAQTCISDLETAQKEKQSVEGELKKVKEKAQALEAKTRETEDVVARTKKDLQNMEHKYTQEVQHKKALEVDLRNTIKEKLALQADLKKTAQNLGQCEVTNAKLCIIADEILKQYRSKGVGAALLQKEPLTQVKKVELEQFTQQYRDEIEKQKFHKK